MTAASPDPIAQNHDPEVRPTARIVAITTGRIADPVAAGPLQEDQALARAILDGDGQAFARLHALYSRRIFRFAVKRLGDATEAEDVVQDTFLEVHRCLGSWEGRSRLLTWMFGIAHHQLCRRFRKKTPIGIPIEQLEATPPVAPEVPSERRLDAARVLDLCADALDDDVSAAQREIFDLYYGENRPTRQIAKELGKSNQAVKISLFRTRRAMEARLEAHDMLASA
jgi:RNA polymerase sigma-70 factor (ECF subfamily)